jgi:sporulation protein YlmC with PRC-barrel domain
MRLTDLLGSEAVTSDGRSLGRVHDVRLVQDGPTLGDWGAAFRVHDLVVGRGSLGTRLGYRHGHVKAPWLFRVLFGRQTPELVPWSAVRSVDADAERIVVDMPVPTKTP